MEDIDADPLEPAEVVDRFEAADESDVEVAAAAELGTLGSAVLVMAFVAIASMVGGGAAPAAVAIAVL